MSVERGGVTQKESSMKIVLFSLIAVMTQIFGNKAYCAPKIKICLTGTTVKAFPKYGQAFYNASIFAKEQFIAENPSWSVQIERHYYDRTPFGALQATESMIEGGCHAAVGYSTGNDLIVASDYLEKNPMFVMSLYGDGHPKLKKTPFVMTMVPNQDFFTGGLLDRLEEKLPKQNPFLIVTAVDRSGMVSYRDSFMGQLRKRSFSFLSVDVLEKTGNIENFINFYDNHRNEIGGVIILTRSLLAARITDHITSTTNRKERPFLIGTGYFGSSVFPAYLNYLVNKDVSVYVFKQNCLCDHDPNYQGFIRRYARRFGMGPMVISGYAFDAVGLILKTVKNNSSDRIIVDRAKVIRSMEQATFTGITGVEIKPGFRIETNKLFIIKISEVGYNKI